MKLSSFVNRDLHDYIMPTIEDHVSRMNKIAFEASLLANLVILFCLNRDHPIPCLSSTGSRGQTFFRRCHAAVCFKKADEPLVPKQTKDDLINVIRDTYYAPTRNGPRWNDGSHLGALINNSARRMAVNATTHLSVNLPKKFLAWARYELRMLPFLKAQHRQYAALKVLYLINGNDYEDPRFLSQEG